MEEVKTESKVWKMVNMERKKSTGVNREIEVDRMGRIFYKTSREGEKTSSRR